MTSTSYKNDLIAAAKIGDLEAVKRLVALCNQNDTTHALRWASRNGHPQCVELLIPVSDPKAHDSQALYWAAQNGHTQCVERLIPVSDPKANDSWALRWAAAEGHSECVKLLIPVSDPKANDSQALHWTTTNENRECLDLLFDVSDAEVALKNLQKDFPNDPEKWLVLHDKITAHRQRVVLTEETSQDKSVVKQNKKM